MTTLNYRLMIEGSPVEWVTTTELECVTSDLRTRLAGLQFSGLAIKEDLDLRGCFTESGAMTISICHAKAVDYYGKYPRKVTEYTSEIDGSGDIQDDRVFDVDDATDIAAHSMIHIGTSAFFVDSKDGNELTCWNYWDTMPQTHYVDDGLSAYNTINQFVYDAPPSLEGRRAYLFQYRDDETSDEEMLWDGTADIYGTVKLTTDRLVWCGIVKTSPSLESDGLTWRMTIAPRGEVLVQEAGSDNVYYIKGIYRPYTTACGIQVIGPPWTANGYNYRMTKYVDGYFANTEDFIAAINAALQEIVDEQDTSPVNRRVLSSLRIEDRQDLGCYVLVASIYIQRTETTENDFGIFFLDNGIGCAQSEKLSYGVGLGPWTAYDDLTDRGHSEWNFELNTEYFMPLTLTKDRLFGRDLYSTNMTGSLYPQHRTAQQNWLYQYPALFYELSYDAGIDELQAPQVITTDVAMVSTYPEQRIYCDQELIDKLTTSSTVLIKNNGIDYTVPVSVVGSNYFEYLFVLAASDNSFTISDVPLDGSTEIKMVATSVTGSFPDFISSLMESSYKANLGVNPFLCYSDYYCIDDEDNDTLAMIVQEIAGNDDFLRNRQYFVVDKHTIQDILIEELKLAGYYMAYHSDGRLVVKNFYGNSSGSTNITDDDIVSSANERILWGRNDFGVVSSVKIIDTFKTIEHEYTIRLPNLSVYKNKSKGEFNIKPYSEYNSSNGKPYNFADNSFALFQYLGSGLSTLIGIDYEIIRIPIRSDVVCDLAIGDTVSLTSSYILNTTTGAYGLSNRKALVTGREINLDPANGAVGYLTVLIKSNADTIDYYQTGFAPSLRVTGASLVSGNTWDLETTDKYFCPIINRVDTDFFVVTGVTPTNPPIKVLGWGSSTAVAVTGYITAIASAAVGSVRTVRVQFTGTAPWGGSYTPGTIYTLEMNDWVDDETSNDYVWLGNASRKVFSAAYPAYRYI